PDDKLRRLIEMLGKQSVPPGKLILMVTVDVDVDVDEAETTSGAKDRGEFEPEQFLPETGEKKGRFSESSEIEGRLLETEKTEVVGEQKPSLPKIEVHRLKKSEFNHGLTRNRGVGFSEAEVVILMTDDAVPNDCYLIEQLLLGLSDEKTAVCYARQLPAEDAELPERFSREFNYPSESRRKTSEDLETLGIKAFFCSNVCAAYKRRIFEELGGFTETIFNEDMIFARKALDAGYAIQYQAEAQVIHSHRFSNMEQLRRNYDLAVSQKRHPEVFSDVSSEKEGFKYVGKAYSYFRQNHRGYLILPFAVTCGFRFLGYRLGKIFG
ncbi:MAG: glycosyltransferase, partial [Lachnospiraceae bacterium]|nr:glycosyltransferase [Lachnospiraceae bacterium]